MSSPALFPAFLKLRGRRVVLVGGGTVARSKLSALLAAGAEVTVVSPEVHADIEMARVSVIKRGFVETDLDGAWLVVAAAPPEVNREVAAAAEVRRVFVNAVDDPPHASAYLGGTLRRGGVTIAVSTDGAAPALAGLLREGLESVLPSDLETWTEEAVRVRRDWKDGGIPMADRRPLLLEALNRLYAERRSQARVSMS